MLLEVKEFSVEYPGFHLHPISFQMEEGEILAIIGESGSGKTTLARGLTCLLPEEAVAEGQVLLSGQELLSMTEKKRKPLRMREFAMAFQGSAPYLNPSMTLRAQLGEVLDLEMPRKEQEGYMHRLMEEVGLSPNDLSRYPRELSGGMAQKFMLACAVALRPKLVVLDEPTSALDVHSAAELTALIRRLNEGHGIGFLVITHDMGLAAQLSHRMMVLYEGHLLETGPTAALLDQPRHPYTRGLLQASISLNPVKDIWGIPMGEPNKIHCCPFYGRCTQAVEKCGRCAPELELQGDRRVACHRGGIVKVLEGKAIGKVFGKQRVLENCNLPVYSGEVVALVGRSGVGKTTLANILGGFAIGDFEGAVEFEGRPAEFKTLHKCRGGIQMVFQNSESAINPRMTVEEAVSEPLRLSGKGKEDIPEKVLRALRDVGLPGDAFLQKKIRTLSGGQRQRVALARALTMEPKLLIADEPTAMLDPSGCATVLRLLKGMQNARGFSMLIVTHDLDSALKISDSIYLLKEGSLERLRPRDHVQTTLNELL